MQYTNLAVFAIAGLAAAQSTTTSAPAAGISSGSSAPSGCGSQVDLIIQTCLGSTNALLSQCGANDWDCLCTQSTNVLTCYNNCPSDPNAFGTQQTQISYCNAAKAYGSSSSTTGTQSVTASVSPSLSSVLASLSSTLSAATATTTSGASGASATRSSSASAASASSSGNAAKAVLPAGGFAAALFGLVAVF